VWREIFYRNLPLHSEIIKVRSCEKNDADLITELNNDPCTRKYLGGPLGSTVESSQSKILETHEDILYIIETSDGQQVGYTGFIENDNTDGIDILIIISPKFTKKQIAREVLDLMVKNWRSLFPSKPIAVTTRIDNIPAIKLLEGSGFVRKGEYKDQRGNRNAIYNIT
jgi:RimJ/RimL family protein N-acetyltransferase